MIVFGLCVWKFNYLGIFYFSFLYYVRLFIFVCFVCKLLVVKVCFFLIIWLSLLFVKKKFIFCFINGVDYVVVVYLVLWWNLV